MLFEVYYHMINFILIETFVLVMEFCHVGKMALWAVENCAGPQILSKLPKCHDSSRTGQLFPLIFVELQKFQREFRCFHQSEHIMKKITRCNT